MSSTERRRLAWERGRNAEHLVATWLREQGVCVVARNVRLGHLELDIVARDGPVVLVVEVKCRARAARVSGFASVTPTKQRRLRRAAWRLWNRRYKQDDSVERLRFDVAVVSFESTPPSIEYVKAAF